MSKGQRLGFLAIALVIAVVAVIISSSSGGDDEQEQASATATPAAEQTPGGQQEASPVEPEPTATPTPKPEPPLLTAGKETTLEFEEGDRVAFRVRHDGAEHVHVHGYDIFKDLEPNKTVTISFKADIVGIFEIELEDSAVLLARLKIEP